MHQFYYPLGNDPRITSGESGAAGLAGLTAVLTADTLETARERAGLTSESRVLIFNTEGDTDPNNFRAVTSVGVNL
jgi:diaminopropionate ammonia-lyase